MRYARISQQKIAYIKQLAPHTHTDIIVKKVGVCKSTVNKYIAMMGNKILARRAEWRLIRQRQAQVVMMAKTRKKDNKGVKKARQARLAKRIKEPKPIPFRPSAEYSNTGYLALLKKYASNEAHR